ncbi:MAG: endonuclease/exonuclease/phosphatase family protein [Candidatus Eremiobacteraeota bacterium]|nr:endonuclease/exonuclease/phosphatase family protein [Candidatus Eremiobacteraeota bacterium]MBV9056056.1 endonuclease/exonuclease/phosphatase family protein [Candidatus Eremiobacteraeota bacterium]
MRILALNLRSGGNRTTIGSLIRRCLGHRPDVLALSEFRSSATGAVVRDGLAAAGYAHQAGSVAHAGNGVLLAATSKFASLLNPFGMSDDEYPNAIVEGRFKGLTVYAVYLPGQDRKRPHLRCLIAAAQRANERNAAAIAIGDFNSGRNETDIEINLGRTRLRDEFSTADLYEELEGYWTEAWLCRHPRATEFSWYPFRTGRSVAQSNGWRLDKAFLSPALLPHLRRADYDHGFRSEGLTDHSALIVELDVEPVVP